MQLYCGGQVHQNVNMHGNSGLCVATRLPDGMTLVENRATQATRQQIAGAFFRSSSSYSKSRSGSFASAWSTARIIETI
jgi:hypothetical protein